MREDRRGTRYSLHAAVHAERGEQMRGALLATAYSLQPAAGAQLS